jgi:hypothetical protein
MARIEWVKERLVIWGAWKARREDSGLGFPRINILLSMGGGGAGGYREAVVPINELEAAETDRAVESLKLVKSHLYLTLQYIYVRNTGIRLCAQRMGRAESTIKAQLEQADAEIARWYEVRREQAEASKRSFTP